MTYDPINWPEFFSQVMRESRAIDAAYMTGTLRDKIRELSRNERERIRREAEDQEPSGEEGSELSTG